MMSEQHLIDQLTERTLAQLDAHDGLPSDPQLHARVLERMHERRVRHHVGRAVWKPALLSVLVLANVYMAVSHIPSGASTAAASRQALVRVLAEDLNVPLGGDAHLSPAGE